MRGADVLKLLEKVTVVSDPDPLISVILCTPIKPGETVDHLHARDALLGLRLRDWNEGPCGTCGHAVWVDPESLRIAPAAKLVCLDCFMAANQEAAK